MSACPDSACQNEGDRRDRQLHDGFLHRRLREWYASDDGPLSEAKARADYSWRRQGRGSWRPSMRCAARCAAGCRTPPWPLGFSASLETAATDRLRRKGRAWQAGRFHCGEQTACRHLGVTPLPHHATVWVSPERMIIGPQRRGALGLWSANASGNSVLVLGHEGRLSRIGLGL